MKVNKYRFVPKTYGWGLTPISIEGWLVVLFMVLVIVGFARGFLGDPSTEPTVGETILFFLAVMFISFFPILCLKPRIKGELRWRWGQKDVDWNDDEE